jgi:protein SDA1
LRCQDKILRKKLHDVIISDLQKINLNHKNNNINKTLQNFCINNMLNDPNKKAARKTLNIMISLYKKKIWNDAKTVNALATTCTSTDPKISFASCQFFLSEYEEAEDDSSDEEEIDELKNRYKLLGKANGKKTKARKNKLKLLMKSIERREKRRSKVDICKDFMPIDLLNDPTNFAEKLFSKLKNLKENFKLKLSLLRLIGRVVGRHKLFINNYFSYLLSYLSPTQSEITVILAALIESCHDIIPPGELEPVMHKLFDNFVSETLPAPYITIGLNAVREIIERAPYVISPEYITVIETLKEFKNKSVRNSARSLINCLKEINSNVLNIYDKDREKNVYFGQSKASESIEGIELLKRHEKLPEDYKMEYDVILDDMQLKKLRVLRMKFNAEKVQNKKINLDRKDINEMAGDKNEDDESHGDVEDNQDEEEVEDLEDLEDLEDFEGMEDEDFEGMEELDEGDEEIEDDEDQDEDDLDQNPKAKNKLSNKKNQLNKSNISNLNPNLSLHEDENDELSLPSEEDDPYAIDSDELKTPSNESEDEVDPHGFIDPGQINTYKKKFNEKKDQLKNEEKEKYSHQRKQKIGGKTNKEKLKNKPLMMVIPKKRRQVQVKLESMNKKIKNLKVQLGRFKRGNMTLKKKGGLTHKK